MHATRDISVFVEEADGSYRRVDEQHVLRLYRREEVAALLTATGFEVAVGEAYGPAGDGDRVPGWYVVTARKP